MNSRNEVAERTLRVQRILDASCGRLKCPSKLVDMIQPGVAIHVKRRGGKTNALLHAIYEREQGNAILVVLNSIMQDVVLDEWERIAKPHKRWKISVPEVMLAPTSFFKICGRYEPIYCDEWFKFSGEVQGRLRDTGRIAGAIGTDPIKGNETEVFPL